MSDLAVRVVELGKQYRLGSRARGYKSLRESLAASAGRGLRTLAGRQPRDETPTIWALRDVSFEVRRGEVLGIIGRNGAGKSTLLKILSRITEPTRGRAEVYGRVGSLLEVGTGFHPELTGRENVYLNGAVLGMKRLEIDRKFDEIVQFAGVEAFIDTPIKHYSTGMQVRLAFAVAAHLDSEILFVDEVLSVGDVEFQRKCLDRMRTVTSEGRTVLLVSHDMASIRSLCGRVLLLDRGRLARDSTASVTVAEYLSAQQPGQGVVDAAELEARMTGYINRTDPTVRCREIAVLDSSGAPRTSFDSDEEVHVRVTYECLHQVSDFRVIVSLVDDDSRPLLVSQSLDDPQSAARLRPGLYRSTCVLPPRLFGERNVQLTVALEVVKTEHLIFERVVSFAVHFVPYNDVVYGSYAEIVLRPQFIWRTVEV